MAQMGLQYLKRKTDYYLRPFVSALVRLRMERSAKPLETTLKGYILTYKKNQKYFETIVRIMSVVKGILIKVQKIVTTSSE